MDETERAEREMVVKETMSWIGTPYVSNGDIKNVGVDCGMLLVRVFVDTGLVEPFDPRPYPAQWALHQSAERYLAIVESLAHEIEGPPLPGDLVLFKFGNCWAHGGIVVAWPEIVHASPTFNTKAPCRMENCVQNADLAKRIPRFFSIWPRGEVRS